MFWRITLAFAFGPSRVHQKLSSYTLPLNLIFHSYDYISLQLFQRNLFHIVHFPLKQHFRYTKSEWEGQSSKYCYLDCTIYEVFPFMIGSDSHLLSWKNLMSSLLLPLLTFPLTFVQRKFHFGWEKYFFMRSRDLHRGITWLHQLIGIFFLMFFGVLVSNFLCYLQHLCSIWRIHLSHPLFLILLEFPKYLFSSIFSWMWSHGLKLSFFNLFPMLWPSLNFNWGLLKYVWCRLNS